MTLRASLADIRPLTRVPAFRRLWLSTPPPIFGGQLGPLAVTFHVWDPTRGPAMVDLIGLFTAASLIASALLLHRRRPHRRRPHRRPGSRAAANRVDRRRAAPAATWGQLATSPPRGHRRPVHRRCRMGRGMLGLALVDSAFATLGRLGPSYPDCCPVTSSLPSWPSTTYPSSWCCCSARPRQASSSPSGTPVWFAIDAGGTAAPVLGSLGCLAGVGLDRGPAPTTQPAHCEAKPNPDG